MTLYLGPLKYPTKLPAETLSVVYFWVALYFHALNLKLKTYKLKLKNVLPIVALLFPFIINNVVELIQLKRSLSSTDLWIVTTKLCASLC